MNGGSWYSPYDDTYFTHARKNRSHTHIVASGLDDGTKVTVCAALSGRFWSPRAAPNLLAWMTWCDEQGAKILDSNVDLEHDGWLHR
ncbi:hypothetical protein [Streptomyces sp. YKOK-I1]